MSSILSGYEFDIFISYRHNDNRSGWVTDFVNALQEELASTIKEPLSIYFDKNPQDGLLETHNVDKSLEGKLKCLIFIPIISQTYCDIKSFAWQHEFVAFNKLAKEDQFGRDVKLSNGNVASRILPIKIHELDAEDKSLFENEIGGVLRAIDFIYKEAGVNRPLKSNDNKTDNQNKTDYRNQINKVANAIKELTGTLKPSEKTLSKKIEENIVYPNQRTRKLGAIIAAIVFILALAAYFLYPKINLDAASSTIDKSIAVLPFVNMSNDPEQEYFSDGMTDEVLNRLFKIGDLKVISRTSSMKFKGAKLTTKEIADQLGVTNILEGSVQKAGNRLKITVQLIDATTDNHLWSETYEREMQDVFAIQSEIAQAVAKQLRTKLSAYGKAGIQEVPTENQLAYVYYLKGIQTEDFEKTIQLLSSALDEDSLFAEARYARFNDYLWTHWSKLSDEKTRKDYVSRATKDLQFLKDHFPQSHQYKKALALHYYWMFRRYDDALKLYDEVLAENPNDFTVIEFISVINRRKGKWNEAIEGLEKCLQSDPLNVDYMFQLAQTYQFTRQHEKALEVFKLTLTVSTQQDRIRGYMVGTMINMGYDITNALKEAGMNNEEWIDRMNRDFLNPGSTAHLNKLRTQKDFIEGQNGFTPISLLYSEAYHFQGDQAKAKIYADSAITFLNNKISSMQDDARIYASLGVGYALAGNEKLALENGNRAMQILPLSTDALDGVSYEVNMVRIYILLKQYDLAMDKIEMLLSISSGPSIEWMMADPRYEPLRKLPRFKQFAEKYKYVKKG